MSTAKKLRAAQMLINSLQRIASPAVTLSEVLGEYVNAGGDLTLRQALAKWRLDLDFNDVVMHGLYGRGGDA